MPSPFISVSRRRKRFGASRRLNTVAAVVVVALLGMVVPAFGGPSAISVAKKALKVANKANRKSNTALLRATRGPANGSIRNEDISAGAVGTGKIANGSVTTADIAGIDINGSINGVAGAVPAHLCQTATIDIGGAQVGDVALFTFTGENAATAGLTFQILKITSPDHGTMRFCNPTDSASPAFSDVGVRILTFH